MELYISLMGSCFDDNISKVLKTNVFKFHSNQIFSFKYKLVLLGVLKPTFTKCSSIPFNTKSIRCLITLRFIFITWLDKQCLCPCDIFAYATRVIWLIFDWLIAMTRRQRHDNKWYLSLNFLWHMLMLNFIENWCRFVKLRGKKYLKIYVHLTRIWITFFWSFLLTRQGSQRQ